MSAAGEVAAPTLAPQRTSLGSAEETTRILNRLRRAQGQLGGVIRMIEQDQPCRDVVPQVAAVSKALDRAGFAIIAAGLRECTAKPGGSCPTDVNDLEKLFLSLS